MKYAFVVLLALLVSCVKVEDVAVGQARACKQACAAVDLGVEGWHYSTWASIGECHCGGPVSK